MQYFRLTTLLLLLAFALALVLPHAAAAQRGIDDAWVKAQKSCAALDNFKATYPAPNRYSGQYASTARKLNCQPPATRPSPTVRQTPAARPTPRVERPRPAPTSRPKPQVERRAPPPVVPREAPSVVTLAPSGGDTPSLDYALSLVRAGGTIKVRPGRYRVSQYISKTVRIEGDSGAYARTIFEGRITIGSGGSVAMANITMRATESGNVVNASGPFSCYSCVIESNYGGSGAQYALIQVSNYATLRLEGSVVQSQGACSSDSYCANIWFNDSAGMGSAITGCYFTFNAYAGVYVAGGSLYVTKTTFIGWYGSAIRQAKGTRGLTVTDSNFSVTNGSKFYVIQTDDGANFQMRNNNFTGITKGQVLYVNGSPINDVTQYSTGNRMN